MEVVGGHDIFHFLECITFPFFRTSTSFIGFTCSVLLDYTNYTPLENFKGDSYDKLKNIEMSVDSLENYDLLIDGNDAKSNDKKPDHSTDGKKAGGNDEEDTR
jgi:hypothetical protein